MDYKTFSTEMLGGKGGGGGQEFTANANLFFFITIIIFIFFFTFLHTRFDDVVFAQFDSVYTSISIFRNKSLCLRYFIKLKQNGNGFQ